MSKQSKKMTAEELEGSKPTQTLIKAATVGLVGDGVPTVDAEALYARVVDEAKRTGVAAPAWPGYIDALRALGYEIVGDDVSVAYVVLPSAAEAVKQATVPPLETDPTRCSCGAADGGHELGACDKCLVAAGRCTTCGQEHEGNYETCSECSAAASGEAAYDASKEA